MAPPAKKQKVEEEKKGEAAADEPAKDGEESKLAKVPEPAKEHETDAAEDSRPKHKEAVKFLTPDTTLNVLPSEAHNILMSLNEGGMQHLMAGARANVGITKGRYMFEVKVLEHVTVTSEQKGSHCVRVGFSTAGSDLILGSSEQNVCFDSSEGFFMHHKTRSFVNKFHKGDVVAVLLNLVQGSQNANTVSLFKNGKRAGQPQPLPDCLKGKALFPHVSFKAASVHVNCGPAPLAPLPFTCHMVQDAAKADVSVTPLKAPADGKYEVLFPVGLPDEGTFEWLDTFLEKNPSYTELSDRMILSWCEKSGIPRKGGYLSRSCNDKPDSSFGVPELDNTRSISNALFSMANLQARNYVVMEVRAGLLQDDRKLLVGRFDSPSFRKTAMVVVGEPTPEFKKRTQQILLKEKQEANERAYELRKKEAERKKQLAKKQKELEKQKKKAEKERQKKLAEAKKKAAELAKKVKGEEEKKEEEEKEEEKEEEEEDEEEEEEMEVEVEPLAKAELTAEEKKLAFRKKPIKDLTAASLSASFAKFSLPTEDEGFDEVKYLWSQDGKAQDYLKKWILDRKLNLRVEELKPSAWFNTELNRWQTASKSWQTKLSEFKSNLAKKAQAKAQKEAKKKAAAAKAAAKKAQAEKEGKPVEEEKEEAEEEEEEEETVDFEGVDIFGADDILDVGASTPLFKEFQAEDWAIMSLRFELHILAHAFRKDVGDPERVGISMDHMPFYYNKYFKKNLNPKDYGVETCKEVAELAYDTVYVTPQNVLETQLPADMETFAVFVKLTEEARRVRLLKIALGEENAKLKLAMGALGGGAKPGPQKSWGNSWQQAQGNGKSGKGGNRFQPYGRVY